MQKKTDRIKKISWRSRYMLIAILSLSSLLLLISTASNTTHAADQFNPSVALTKKAVKACGGDPNKRPLQGDKNYSCVVQYLKAAPKSATGGGYTIQETCNNMTNVLVKECKASFNKARKDFGLVLQGDGGKADPAANGKAGAEQKKSKAAACSLFHTAKEKTDCEKAYDDQILAMAQSDGEAAATANDTKKCDNLGYGGDKATAACKDAYQKANSSGSNDTPCHGGALGWILCPLVNTMADGVRAIASFIDGTLQFKILANNSQADHNGIKDYWGRFVGLANILLVIAFLFIIYSQATGAGLSNYGIKRMLPRIVLAAILINLSFYICALAIDVTNIIGNAVLGFFTGDSQGISAGLAKQAGLSGPGGFQSAVGATLGAAIGVVLIVLFFTPLLLGVLVTFILLIARQVILIALVMVSPLAFAAWLLPNTEEYFKKWRKIFTDMLVAYPVIMAVFGVSLFASKVIGDISTQSTKNSTDLITGGTVSYIVSLVILAVPLLALPFLLKSASGSLGKVAGQFDRFKRESGLEGGLNKVQGGAKGFAKRKALNTEARMADADPNTRRGNLAQRIGRHRGVRKFNLASQERENARIQEEATGAYYGEDGRRGEKRRKKAAGAGYTGDDISGGAARVAQEAESVNRKRRLEELERQQQPLKEEQQQVEAQKAQIKTRIRPGSTVPHPTTGAPMNQDDQMIHGLETAMQNGNAAETRAFMDLIAQEGGKGQIARMGDSVQSHLAANAGAQNPEISGAVAQAVQQNFPAIKAADPRLLATNAQTGAVGNISVSEDQLGSMAGPRLEQLAASGDISPEMVGSAAAAGKLSGLDTQRRTQLERGLSGLAPGVAGPVPQAKTIDDLRVEHQAEATRRGQTPSDRRLKVNIVQIDSFNSIPLYKFEYKWSKQQYVGTMAQDILQTHPQAVSVGKDGYYRVDYSQLGFDMVTYKDWQKR